jgi:3-oxoacyl-[acyl-carrier protein] reductase
VVSVAVVGGDSHLAAALADRLREAGASVVTIGDSLDTGDGQLQCDLSSTEAIADCLTSAESTLDSQPAVVRLGMRTAQSVVTELATLTIDEWALRAEAPLREGFAFHQAAQRFLSGRAGRVLVIVPTVGLSGAAGLVPLSAAAEADRSLVKAQARVSGQRGVTINCIAVDSALLAGNEVDLDRGGLPARTLVSPDLRQLADVIIALLGPSFDAITGQTIAVDGGRWMAS